jgi:hypothetical protein
MSTTGEAKPSQGPKGPSACESGRPTRGRCGSRFPYNEADR